VKEFEQSEYMAKAQVALKEPVEESPAPVKKSEKTEKGGGPGR